MEKIIPNPEKNFATNNSLHLAKVVPSSNGIVDTKNGDTIYNRSNSNSLRINVMIDNSKISNTRIELIKPTM